MMVGFKYTSRRVILRVIRRVTDGNCRTYRAPKGRRFSPDHFGLMCQCRYQVC